ncbi:MAG: hypothetical protein MUE69_01980 [Myxococcota bacterium]|jgi:hypothetical protein|nr:hypothetical protein [Myxococcota bacterium]
MNYDAYEQARSSAGKLKLKARAKLAFGEPDETFEACVLLHEAARIERRAVRLVDATVETKLAALAEACACLLLGLDPPGAIGVWAEIVQLRVAADRAANVLVDLEAIVEKTRREFTRRAPNFEEVRETALFPMSDRDRRRMAADVKAMLSHYPGIASLWWVQSHLLTRRKSTAWGALDRAFRLDPDSPHLEAARVLSAVELLPKEEAAAQIESARTRIGPERPMLCLSVALAELHAASRASKAKRALAHTRALDAVRVGLAGTPPSPWFERLRAAQNVLELLLADQEPTLEVLYASGLTNVALHAKPGEAVVELLTQSVKASAA